MGLSVALFGLFDFCALVVSFFSLCIVCDEHLVPAVEVFIVQFEVPEEVAGKIVQICVLSFSIHFGAA